MVALILVSIIVSLIIVILLYILINKVNLFLFNFESSFNILISELMELDKRLTKIESKLEIE